MGSFDDLAPGTTFTSPSRVVGADDVTRLVELGGYTHPLFTDPAYAAERFGGIPLPGEGLLHVMGGLVEQSGRFDDTTIALVGLRDVRFHAPATAGVRVRVEVEVTDRELRSGGRRGLVTMAWRCHDDAGGLLAEAAAQMLFAVDAG